MNLLYGKPSKLNAYVWMLIIDDKYLPGILVSMYSMEKHLNASTIDLVCMVTSDISFNSVEQIKKIADVIYQINYIKYKSSKLLTNANRALYEHWTDASYTKWNIMLLPYKRAVYIDADMICLRNVDELFDLHTIAMLFTNTQLNIPDKLKCDKTVNNVPIHNTLIEPENIMQILTTGSIVGKTSIMAVSPNKIDYDAFINLLTSYCQNKPFGFKKVMNRHDDQAICYYLAVNKEPIANIAFKFACVPGKEAFLFGEKPSIIHYEHKPWLSNPIINPSAITWYKLLGECTKKYKFTNLNINLSLLDYSMNACDTYVSKLGY